MMTTYDIIFFSSRRRHTNLTCDWSSDVCSSDLIHRADAAFTAQVSVGSKADDAKPDKHPASIEPAPTKTQKRKFPAGSYVIRMDQPYSRKIGRASCRERV